jgi:hypothetical protein
VEMAFPELTLLDIIEMKSHMNLLNLGYVAFDSRSLILEQVLQQVLLYDSKIEATEVFQEQLDYIQCR